MTPAEALDRFDAVIRRVVTDHHKIASRHGFEWSDMYQEACLAVFESLHGITTVQQPRRNAYVAEIVRRTMVERFTYTPASGIKPERVRDAQRGANMGGAAARAAAPTVSTDDVELADETLMPDLAIAEDEAGNEDDMLALCEEALRIGNFTTEDQLCIKHLMHGRPSLSELECLWGCDAGTARRKIRKTKSALSKAMVLASQRMRQ